MCKQDMCICIYIYTYAHLYCIIYVCVRVCACIPTYGSTLAWTRRSINGETSRNYQSSHGWLENTGHAKNDPFSWSPTRNRIVFCGFVLDWEAIQKTPSWIWINKFSPLASLVIFRVPCATGIIPILPPWENWCFISPSWLERGALA